MKATSIKTKPKHNSKLNARNRPANSRSNKNTSAKNESTIKSLKSPRAKFLEI
ncbi:MAG TPA: hypothetical protein VFL70_05470 [Bacteroidia bacterium]|nr:hypothetical protein [Bacteroidia bacterium]